MIGDFFAGLNRTGPWHRGPARSRQQSLGRALLDLMANATINGRIGKEVLEAMMETGEQPSAIIEAPRPATGDGYLRTIDVAVDGGALRPIRISWRSFAAGKNKLFGFFVGPGHEGDGRQGQPSPG